MDATTIERVEKATLDAVPPTEVLALDGWLVPLDAGTVGRARSAVPTRHDGVRVDLVPDILAAYAARSLAPAFRVADVPGGEALQAALQAGGLVPAKPTLVQLGTVADLGAADRGAPVTIAERPDAAWEALFLGPGFDPVDGASRAAILRRSRASVFAAVRQGQEVVAVGSACFSQGLCGVHGMRTAPAWRGRGLAGSILGAFAREARARGITQVLLQVEEANTGAQSLYRRAGLRTAWRYRYWQPG